MTRQTPVPDALGERLADFANLRSALDYDAIVCASQYAAEEFRRNDIRTHVVHLGVDLDVFAPARPAPRHGSGESLAPDGSRRREGSVQVVHCGRLAREKNPWLSIETVRELVGRGVDAHLTVLGHGPLREELIEASEDLPVSFHSYIHGRRELAAVMRRADVAIAPGPVETFGLAALEAMACGVPTVCPDEGALQEVVGSAGIAAPSEPGAFADAVLELLDRPGARESARARAEEFSWPDSAQLMLQVHEGLRELPHRP